MIDLSSAIRLDIKLKSARENLSRSKERREKEARDRYLNIYSPNTCLLSKEKAQASQQPPFAYFPSYRVGQQTKPYSPAKCSAHKHPNSQSKLRPANKGRDKLENKLRSIEVGLEIKDILLKNSRRDERKDYHWDSFLKESMLLNSFVLDGPHSLRLSGNITGHEEGNRSFRGTIRGSCS